MTPGFFLRSVVRESRGSGGRLAAVGRHEEALEVGRRALEIRRQILGDRHMRVAFSMESVGASLLGLGRLDEARRMLEDSLAMRRELEGEFAENLKIPYRLLADLHRQIRTYVPGSDNGGFDF